MPHPEDKKTTNDDLANMIKDLKTEVKSISVNQGYIIKNQTYLDARLDLYEKFL